MRPAPESWPVTVTLTEPPAPPPPEADLVPLAEMAPSSTRFAVVRRTTPPPLPPGTVPNAEPPAPASVGLRRSS